MLAHLGSFLDGPKNFATAKLFPVRTRDHADHRDFFTRDSGASADRHVTAPAQTIEQSAFGRDLAASRRVVKESEKLAHVAVAARFEAEGALSDSADADLVRPIFADAIRAANSSKPCRGHHQRVEFARVKFLEPRVDIAAQREHTQV